MVPLHLALSHPDTAIVTGAFSFTGRYVARRLLDQVVSVRTLTGNPGREDPFCGWVPAARLDFSDPEGLRRSMREAGVPLSPYLRTNVSISWEGEVYDRHNRAESGCPNRFIS